MGPASLVPYFTYDFLVSRALDPARATPGPIRSMRFGFGPVNVAVRMSKGIFLSRTLWCWALGKRPLKFFSRVGDRLLHHCRSTGIWRKRSPMRADGPARKPKTFRWLWPVPLARNWSIYHLEVEPAGNVLLGDHTPCSQLVVRHQSAVSLTTSWSPWSGRTQPSPVAHPARLTSTGPCPH